MTDTPIEMAERFRSMILARSGEDRLKMGCSMHETAQALVIASLKENTSNLTRDELRRGLFLRFYGGDFDKKTAEKILVTLTNAG